MEMSFVFGRQFTRSLYVCSQGGQKMFWKNPARFHLISVLVPSVVGTLAFWWFLAGRQHSTWKHWLICWLFSVNIVTFLWYGVDKYISKQALLFWFRVPEKVLHMLSIIGGSPSALLAMMIFRHKTIKPSF